MTDKISKVLHCKIDEVISGTSYIRISPADQDILSFRLSSISISNLNVEFPGQSDGEVYVSLRRFGIPCTECKTPSVNCKHIRQHFILQIKDGRLLEGRKVKSQIQTNRYEMNYGAPVCLLDLAFTRVIQQNAPSWIYKLLVPKVGGFFDLTVEYDNSSESPSETVNLYINDTKKLIAQEDARERRYAIVFWLGLAAAVGFGIYLIKHR